MTYNGRSRDVVAVIAAVFSLGIAIGVAILLKRFELLDDSAIIIVILLLPLLVYGVASGRLRELRAPGGWGATFTQTARKRVKDFVMPVKPIIVHIGFSVPSDEGLPQPPDEELRQNPNALKIILDGIDAYLIPICDYLYYINHQLAAETVRYIIIVDASDKFISLIPITSVSTEPELLTPDGTCKAYELIEWIGNEDFDKLDRLKGSISKKKAASPDWSRRRCLQEMFDESLEALPVVKNEKLIGILERTQLVTSIFMDVSERLLD